MNKILFVFLVLSISGCLQTAEAAPFYNYWENCRESLVDFSLWYQNTDYANYPVISSLLDCDNQGYYTKKELSQCGDKAIKRISTEQLDIVETFFDHCIIRKFEYNQSLVPDYKKCYKATEKCLTCLTEDRNCNTFKIASTPRNIEYEAARNPTNCVELQACNQEKIGFFASGYCTIHIKNNCGYKYVLTHAPFDKCIGYELCDPYRQQHLDFDTLGEQI